MAHVRAQIGRDESYLVGEGSLVSQAVTEEYQTSPASSEADYQGPIDSRTRALASLRYGANRLWWGGEIGLGGWLDTGDGSGPVGFVLPASEIRLGRRDWAYAWGNEMSGPITGQGLPAAAGIGHDDGRFRVRAGVGTQGVLLLGQVCLGDGIWLGVRSLDQNHLNWSTSCMLTLPLEGEIAWPHPFRRAEPSP
jgi:hypothetical protein